MMYDELIKQLRASCEDCKLWDGYKCCLKGECSAQTRLQAADAIEELICEVADEHNARLDAAYAIEELRKAVLRLEDESGLYDELPTFYIYPTKWIPVTEQLPNENGEYFVSGKGKVWVCEFMILGDVGGWCNSAKNPCVKYWMPRPEPPEEE